MGSHTFGGNYDGVYGKQTSTAISEFQNGYKLVGKNSVDKAGKVVPNGETIKKLNAMLPANYKSMRIIANTKTVYLAGDAKEAVLSKLAVTGNANIQTNFKTNVGKLIQTMFEQHKIVLRVTKTGFRRTFAEQAALTKTNAGPGESNHNFGRAVDIGFKGIKWLQGNGKIVTDADWLNTLVKKKTSINL